MVVVVLGVFVPPLNLRLSLLLHELIGPQDLLEVALAPVHLLDVDSAGTSRRRPDLSIKL